MYDEDILHILTAVGQQGIKLRKLAKHVYNMNCTLFSQPDFHEVLDYVHKYLIRNSRTPQSLIERAGKRGYYRLNARCSGAARLLLANYQKRGSDTAGNGDSEDEKPQVDLSLSLFD